MQCAQWGSSQKVASITADYVQWGSSQKVASITADSVQKTVTLQDQEWGYAPVVMATTGQKALTLLTPHALSQVCLFRLCMLAQYNNKVKVITHKIIIILCDFYVKSLSLFNLNVTFHAVAGSRNTVSGEMMVGIFFAVVCAVLLIAISFILGLFAGKLRQKCSTSAYARVKRTRDDKSRLSLAPCMPPSPVPGESNSHNSGVDLVTRQADVSHTKNHPSPAPTQPAPQYEACTPQNKHIQDEISAVEPEYEVPSVNGTVTVSDSACGANSARPTHAAGPTAAVYSVLEGPTTATAAAGNGWCAGETARDQVCGANSARPTHAVGPTAAVYSVLEGPGNGWCTGETARDQNGGPEPMSLPIPKTIITVEDYN